MWAVVQRLSRDVSGAMTAEDAGLPVLAELASACGSRAAALWVPDRVGLRCAATWVSTQTFDPFATWCRRFGHQLHENPVAKALASGFAVQVLEPLAGGSRSQAFASCGLSASLAVPLLSGSSAVAAIELVGDDRLRFDDDAAALVDVVGTMLGLRIVELSTRAELHEAMTLQSALFDAALDAFIAIDDEGRITVFSPSAERMFGYSSDEVIGLPVRDIVIPPQFRPFHDEGMARYRETGEGRLIGARVRLAAMRRDGTQFPIELAVVPVDATGRTAFATFVRDATPEAVVEEALLESGQRFAEQARALQRSFLPAEIPPIENLDLAVRYASAGEDTDVGGDFYDVFGLPGGGWAIEIGDVQGKGIEAASVMALARFTIRALAARRSTLRTVVLTLNDVLSSHVPNRLCTLLYGRIVPVDGGMRLTYVLAGHPQPLHMTRHGVRAVGRPGMMLGVMQGMTIAEQRVHLAPGDVLVLYTDGLTEARSQGGDFLGEEHVHQQLERCRDLDAASIALRLERLALEFQSGNARDDIALIVIRVPEAPRFR